jgi:hypothetical protein
MMNRDQTVPVVRQMNIHARVCPCGSVYLYVGHTCLFLRQEEFLDMAQLVHAVENHLLAEADEISIDSLSDA